MTLLFAIANFQTLANTEDIDVMNFIYSLMDKYFGLTSYECDELSNYDLRTAYESYQADIEKDGEYPEAIEKLFRQITRVS